MIIPLHIKLKELRELRGMTQDNLAEKSGYSQSYIGHLERGKTRPSYKALERLATAFNVPLRELIPDDEKDKVYFDEFASYLSAEDKAFLAQQKGRPWFRLAKELDEEGLTPEDVRELLQLVRKIKNKT